MDKEYYFTGYNSRHKEAARMLRKEMTHQECRLWYDFLRTYPIKVYRQRPIDQYIVDFYCSKAHLVIELDGCQHYTQDGIAYDMIRTEILEKYQLKVIRFSNREVDEKFSAICTVIDREIKERIHLPFKNFNRYPPV